MHVAASVLGRTFTVDALQQGHPDPDTVVASIDRLQRRELVQVLPGAGSEVQFRHAMIRDAAYSLLSFDHRRSLNRAVAGWYEATAVDRSGVTPGRLAHHWLECGEDRRAVPHLALAGRRALESAAFEEAVGFYDQAISIAGAASDADWLAQLGRAHVSLGRLEQGERALLRSLDVAGVPQPEGSRVPLALVRALGEHTRRRLGRHVADRSTDELEVMVHEDLANIYYLDSRTNEAMLSVVRQLNAAEGCGSEETIVRGLASMATTCGFVSLYGLADRYEALTVDQAATAGDARTAAFADIFLSVHFVGIGGRWDELFSRLDRAEREWVREGEPWWEIQSVSLHNPEPTQVVDQVPIEACAGRKRQRRQAHLKYHIGHRRNSQP